MKQTIYDNILLASFVVMYAYGLFSFFTISPKGKEYDSYRYSRRLFGMIMTIWASFLVIHWYFNLRQNNPILASTLSFSYYFPGIMLFEVAFTLLISPNYPISKRIKQIALNTLYVGIILYLNYLLSPPKLQEIVLYSVGALFTIKMWFLSRRFLRTYRNAQKLLNNHAHSKDIFINWMQNSVYVAIALGFAGPVVLFTSSIPVSVYMLCGVLLFTYIFISYQNYMLNIKKINRVLLADNKPSKILVDKPNHDNKIDNNNTNEMNYIEKSISLWIANKGFTKRDVTIEELATKFKTNRTYLSSYIRATYNLSFREWIAVHRIEYAKELLLSNEDLASNKIAEMVGYSPNAFTTIFSKIVKMSPMQWRNANK